MLNSTISCIFFVFPIGSLPIRQKVRKTLFDPNGMGPSHKADVRVDGQPPFVLASDNCYFYRNLERHLASATFSEADHEANIKNQARMIELAGSVDRVVPGHDALQFQKFATEGRIAKIR